MREEVFLVTVAVRCNTAELSVVSYECWENITEEGLGNNFLARNFGCSALPTGSRGEGFVTAQFRAKNWISYRHDEAGITYDSLPAVAVLPVDVLVTIFAVELSTTAS